MKAIILEGRGKAREVFDSEIFTLNQYLKDEEMKALHGKRFYKMLAAMQTALRIFDWLDEKPNKSVSEELRDNLEQSDNLKGVSK